MNSKNTIKDYIFLYIAFVIFSISSVMNKLASGCDFLSLKFFFFYSMGLLILLLYALLWQKVLKHFDLTVVYANRAVVTLLGMVWGVLVFQETLTWNMVLGAVIIFIGIRIVVIEHGT